MARRLPGLARRLSGGASKAIAAPSRWPALKSAIPADAGHGLALDAGSEVEVMLTDGTWTRAAVRARRRDARDRWCVLLSWSSGPAAGRRQGGSFTTSGGSGGRGRPAKHGIAHRRPGAEPADPCTAPARRQIGTSAGLGGAD
jgi:hypothetical protein